MSIFAISKAVARNRATRKICLPNAGVPSMDNVLFSRQQQDPPCYREALTSPTYLSAHPWILYERREQAASLPVPDHISMCSLLGIWVSYRRSRLTSAVAPEDKLASQVAYDEMASSHNEGCSKRGGLLRLHRCSQVSDGIDSLGRPMTPVTSMKTFEESSKGAARLVGNIEDEEQDANRSCGASGSQRINQPPVLGRGEYVITVRT